MPEGFERCRAAGGKIITKTLSGNRYMHLCKDKAGHWHKGEVKTKSVPNAKKAYAAAARKKGVA